MLSLSLRQQHALVTSIFFLLISNFLWASENMDENAIREVRALSNKALAEKDVEAFVACLMPDVHVVTSANAQLSGRDQQRDYMQQIITKYPDIVFVRSAVSIEVNVETGSAAETGTWKGGWSESGEAVELEGNYFAKWTKTDAGWLIQAEIFVGLK